MTILRPPRRPHARRTPEKCHPSRGLPPAGASRAHDVRPPTFAPWQTTTMTRGALSQQFLTFCFRDRPDFAWTAFFKRPKADCIASCMTTLCPCDASVRPRGRPGSTIRAGSCHWLGTTRALRRSPRLAPLANQNYWATQFSLSRFKLCDFCSSQFRN